MAESPDPFSGVHARGNYAGGGTGNVNGGTVRGDFSRWQFKPRDNFNGILPQQGKLLIDADGLAQTRIANHWNQTAARDWVGPVAAVPADEPASFQISAATINADGTVSLAVGTGHAWADGLLVQLGDDTATVQRTA